MKFVYTLFILSLVYQIAQICWRLSYLVNGTKYCFKDTCVLTLHLCSTSKFLDHLSVISFNQSVMWVKLITSNRFIYTHSFLFCPEQQFLSFAGLPPFSSHPLFTLSPVSTEQRARQSYVIVLPAWSSLVLIAGIQMPPMRICCKKNKSGSFAAGLMRSTIGVQTQIVSAVCFSCAFYPISLLFLPMHSSVIWLHVHFPAASTSGFLIISCMWCLQARKIKWFDLSVDDSLEKSLKM